ncbi:MAG TPA: cation:proton antiporter [Terriglobales bacterium]|nr:cation:proton antiporter [Terriglobales bacterium]
MNELTSLGLILLLALAAGHLVKFLRVPEVTGYILIGVILGPSVLAWINGSNLQALGVFSEVALGLILFSIGSVFELRHFRRVGPRAIILTMTESLLVAGLLVWSMRAMGQSWEVALLLGAIGMETAAASSLMVLRETNATGPLTETLTAFLAVNNVFCLLCFTIVAGGIAIHQSLAGEATTGAAVYASLFDLVWQLVGSAALGYLVGLLLAAWASRVVEHGETLILLTGCILLAVGLAVLLHLSTLVTSLAIGATTANLSGHSRRILNVQSRTDPPFYAIFFVIAGANLHLSMLKTVGILGLVYIAARAIGKLAGGRLGMIGTSLPVPVRKYMGMTLLPHAGLAIGLAISLEQLLPTLGPPVATIVLSAVLIYEIIGPFNTRLALVWAGETRDEAPSTEAAELS